MTLFFYRQFSPKIPSLLTIPSMRKYRHAPMTLFWNYRHFGENDIIFLSTCMRSALKKYRHSKKIPSRPDIHRGQSNNIIGPSIAKVTIAPYRVVPSMQKIPSRPKKYRHVQKNTVTSKKYNHGLYTFDTLKDPTKFQDQSRRIPS